MKVTNSLFPFANLSVSVSDNLVKYFLITVKLRVFGILHTEKYRRRKWSIGAVIGAADPPKCRVTREIIGVTIGVVTRKENESWILNY